MTKKMTAKTYQNEAYEILDEPIDYLNFVTRSSTKEQRKKFNIGDVFINAAVCLKCKDFIRSINKHDNRSCSCGAATVDGGSHYARRVGDKKDRIDIIETFYK
jgi:hypothetical protein